LSFLNIYEKVASPNLDLGGYVWHNRHLFEHCLIFLFEWPHMNSLKL